MPRCWARCARRGRSFRCRSCTMAISWKSTPLPPAPAEEKTVNSILPPVTLPGVTLRPMTGAARDLESALQLSRAAGWAYRLEDWRIAQALGQGVLAEENGQVIASALC